MKPIVIHCKEEKGIRREMEPVSLGVPFPAGQLENPGDVKVCDASGNAVPFACTTLASWPDGSVKWLLLITA